MERIIYYFSGTGNSLRAARVIAEETGAVPARQFLVALSPEICYIGTCIRNFARRRKRRQPQSTAAIPSGLWVRKE